MCSANTHSLPYRPKPQPVNDVHRVVPCLRWLVAGLSSKRFGFDPGPPYVGFVVDKLTVGPAFSEHIGFPLSNIIPPLLHTHRHLRVNPLNPELNPICYLLALLGAYHFLHVSRIRVKLLTFRRLMSYIYIYGAPILDVSRSHTTTQHSR